MRVSSVCVWLARSHAASSRRRAQYSELPSVWREKLQARRRVAPNRDPAQHRPVCRHLRRVVVHRAGAAVRRVRCGPGAACRDVRSIQYSGPVAQRHVHSCTPVLACTARRDSVRCRRRGVCRGQRRPQPAVHSRRLRLGWTGLYWFAHRHGDNTRASPGHAWLICVLLEALRASDVVRVVAGMPREISMALLRCHASASADDQCRVGGVATPGDCVSGRAAGGSANRDAQQRHQSVLRADIHDVRHDFCNKVRHHGVSPWLHVGLITPCVCAAFESRSTLVVGTYAPRNGWWPLPVLHAVSPASPWPWCSSLAATTSDECSPTTPLCGQWRSVFHCSSVQASTCHCGGFRRTERV